MYCGVRARADRASLKKVTTDETILTGLVPEGSEKNIIEALDGNNANLVLYSFRVIFMLYLKILCVFI